MGLPLGRYEFLTRENELRMQLDAWMSGVKISQKRYTDNVSEAPAAKVPRPDREARRLMRRSGK